MNYLYVLYDAECAICCACSTWLGGQEALVELRFLPLQSPEVAFRFPGLMEWPDLDLREKLVVISDDGAVYQGQNAWIMCLYALHDYRAWSLRLAHPALAPFARRVCETVSRNRLVIARFLTAPLDELVARLAGIRPQACPQKGKS